MKKILLTLLMLFILSNNTFARAGAINIYDEPRELPKTKIYHESGDRYRLTDFKGKFLVVVFWSKTCGICINELDKLNNFSKFVADDGIKVIAVSPSDEWDSIGQVKKFLKKKGAPDLEVYIDEEGSIASDLGIFSTPQNVLINTGGMEMGRIRGGVEWDKQDVIDYILKLKAWKK